MISASVKISNKISATGGVEKTINILPSGIVANFTVDNATPDEDDVINFTDTSTGSPTSFCWDFGDGTSSLLQNPSHSYATVGLKTVKLISTKEGAGDEEIKVDFIDVQAGFLPSDLPNLVAWYKADAEVYNDDGITLATDGQNVRRWDDQSGNNYNGNQTVGANQPLFEDNELNGKPIVRFDGVSEKMRVADNVDLDFGSGDFSVFIVVKSNSFTTGILIKDNFAGSGNGIYIFSGSLGYSYWNGAGGTTIATRTASFQTIAAIRTGTLANQVKLRNNGVQTGTATDGRNLSNSFDLIIGGASDSGELDGDIAEVIIYDDAKSDVDAGTIDEYLKTKYAHYA